MLVMVRKNAPESRKIYHKPGCIYERRIRRGNRMPISEEDAEKKGYRECKFCAGLKGTVRIKINNMRDRWIEKEGLAFSYDEKTDTVYVTTEIGAWKIFLNRRGKYVLFHMNRYEKGMSFAEVKKAPYHCQRDVKAAASFEKVIKYIIEHDRAKVIIMDDYKKLPHATKKQKRYYKQAERRNQTEQKYRIDAIFAALESSDPELKEYSFC